MNTLKNQQLLFIFAILAGIALVITGGALIKGANLKSLSGVCIGMGAALFSIFTARLVNYRVELKHPEIFRKKNIEVNDERNSIIRGKAMEKANRLFMGLLFLVILVFVLLNVELYITLSMVGLIVIYNVVYIAYFNYFNKRM